MMPTVHPVVRWSWLIVFAVALIARLLHVWLIHDQPFAQLLLGDAHSYDAWAQQLAAGDWIGDRIFYQAPLYPYFLGVVYAVFGHSLTALRLVQAVVGAAGCALLGEAGRQFFGRRAGLVAGLMLALYPPAIFSDAIVQKSVLDLFFLALLLWLCAMMLQRVRTSATRAWWLAGCLGAALGMLMLVRENAAALIVVLVGWLVWLMWKRWTAAATSVAAMVLGLALVLGPVAVRNWWVGGEAHLTTSQFGPNFYIGNNPQADGTYAPLRFGRGHPSFEATDARELAEQALGRPLTPGEVSDYWATQAFDFIREDFRAWLRLTARKTMLLINRVELGDTEDQYTFAEASWLIRWGDHVWHFGILAVLAAGGVVLTARRWRELWVLYAMIGVYAASVVAFFIFARYRLPLAPPLILFAAAGCVAFVKVVKQRRRRPVFAALTVAAIAAMAAHWPLVSVSSVRAASQNNIANALLEQQDNQELALAHYRRAIELEPTYAGAYMNLAQLLTARGDIAGALRCYEQVIQHKPDYAPAYNNAGVLLAQVGNVGDAAGAYQRALALDPDYPEAHNNLGIILAGAGQFEEAIQHYRIALRLRPTYAEAKNNMGTAHARAGRLDLAVIQFRAAITANPDYIEAYENFGYAMTLLEQWPAAAEAYGRAAELRPGDVGLWLAAAQSWASAGQPSAARDAARRGLAAVSPGVPSDVIDALRTLARD